MSGAAIAIQRVFRGHVVRKNIKLLSQIAIEVGEIEGWIHANVARLQVDSKERLRMNEMLMAQLFRLDSVRCVREYRRKVIRKVIALQEFLDAISVQIEESPNSVNSQASAEMNSNYVDCSDIYNDVVITETIEDGEDAEKKSDANVSDEGFKGQDSLACRNYYEEERMLEDEGFVVVAEERMSEDEGFVVVAAERMSEDEGFVVVAAERISEDEEFAAVAAEKATCNSPVDTYSQKDLGLELTGKEIKEKATEEVVQLPEDSAGMTVLTGNGSTEVAGMEEMLKKVMEGSERLQGLVATLCEWNTEQCRLMAGLADRVGNLERAVQRMEKRNKNTK